MDRIAILLLVHRWQPQLKRLVQRLDSEFFDIFIHVDIKADISVFKEKLEGSTTQSNIIFVENRVNCFLVDFSLVEATCRLMDCAQSYGKYTWQILLTGQDYPLKSNYEIYHTLMESPAGLAYIDSYRVEEDADIARWVNNIGKKYYSQRARRLLANLTGRHFYYSQPGKIARMFAVIYDRIRAPFSSSPRNQIRNLGYTYSAGSHFWMLPAEAVSHVLKVWKKDFALNKVFRHVTAPEESYFQTVLTTCPGIKLPDNMLDQFSDLVKEMDNPALRYIKWYENGVHTSGHPAILTATDFPALKKASALFGRKFDETTDSKIFELLDINA